MADVNDALDLLNQVIAETAAREAQEKQDLQREIASLKAKLEAAEKLSILSEMRLDEADRRDEAANTNAPSEPARYHGCYNLSKRRTPVKSAVAVVTILGGQKHLAEELGLSDGTVSGWKDYLPKKFRSQIDELMKERGYFVDVLLYR